MPIYALAHLLRLQYIHQWFHCYINWHNFAIGVYNDISDRPCRSRNLTNASLLAYMDITYPKSLPWRLWTPSSAKVYDIASVLRRKKLLSSYLLLELSPPMGTGQCGLHSSGMRPSTPYSSCTWTWYPSSTPSQGNTRQEPSNPEDIKYNPTRLRKPYGQFSR